jgi:hypothetical protein
MGGRLRKATFRCAAVGLVVAAVIPAASGTASGTKESAVPAPLVGNWTRNVTAADWKRAGATGFVTSFVGPTPMSVKANGNVRIIDFTAKFSPLPRGRVTLSGVPVCYPKTGLYRWKVAGGNLTLTKLKDACAAEVGLFTGVWKKR